MRSESLYRLTAACLVTHELDSILLQGRRTFSLIGGFDQQIFLWAHVPVVLAMLFYAEFSRRISVRYGMCVFAVIHVGLHWVYRNQPVYDFTSVSSWVLILLAGIFGAAYLVPAKAR
ncbi:DUF6713 family protein [Hyphomonas sp.]|jgi:hypothetical protein|uniref:DUF6713 family protein n=1 Tax=Hyphomonas sp. TaxID=87 RepID=UPI003919C7BB